MYVCISFLSLISVKNLETGRSSPGVKMFFGHEIVNVELLDEPDSGKGTTMLSECTSAVEGSKQADTGPADCGLWTSCFSQESQLRASNSLKYSLSGCVLKEQWSQKDRYRAHYLQICSLPADTLTVPEGNSSAFQSVYPAALINCKSG